MKPSSLQAVLDRLTSGDSQAADEVFRQYEPYLRKVVRRLLPMRLRPKFDSIDVVQSAWADLLENFRKSGNRFTTVHQLRAFLVTSVRNRFIDRYRQMDKVAKQEKRETHGEIEQIAAAGQATPSQVMQAGDLWERLLKLCPAEYQAVLLLKRQGATSEEIAAETGLHPGSIRRILRNLASRIAVESSLPSPASEDSP